MLIQRRSFLTGLAAAFAAPAIVKAESLMKVRGGAILPPSAAYHWCGFNDHCDREDTRLFLQQLGVYLDERRSAGWQVTTYTALPRAVTQQFRA